jgi:PPOX class probable F420-dependent enzyme
MSIDVPVASPVPAVVPESHVDLLARPIYGVLSTLMPDGQPQCSLVWVDYDGEYVLVNTTLERQKCRNLSTNPRVTLLVVDPDDGGRWIEVRGRAAEITEDGAIAHADLLTQRYIGKQRFYGDICPPERQAQETRVIVKIAPVKVSIDAIFK